MANNSFLYRVHCEKGVPSSKRLYGGIGWITVQICILAATILSLIQTGELTQILSGLIEFDMVTSAALLGLSTITGMFSGGRSISSTTTTTSTTDRRTEETESHLITE